MKIIEQEHPFIVDDRQKACLCFSFFNIFRHVSKKFKGKPPPQKIQQKFKVSELQNHKEESLIHQAIQNFPQVETIILNIQLQQKDFICQLCNDNSLIGVIGKQVVQFPQLVQIIHIGKDKEIEKIDSIRPFVFQNIFIMDDIQQHQLEDIFSIQQTISIKMDTIKQVQYTIQRWQRFIEKQYSNQLIKNILEKLFIKVTIIKDKFWLTLNDRSYDQQVIKKYNWQSINLKLDEDWLLIKNLNQFINLDQFLELQRMKRQQPYKFNKNIIRNKIMENMPEQVLFNNQKLLSKNSSQNSLKFSQYNSIRYENDKKQIFKLRVQSNQSKSISKQPIYQDQQFLRPLKELNKQHRSLSQCVNQKQYKLICKLRTQSIEEELYNYS